MKITQILKESSESPQSKKSLKKMKIKSKVNNKINILIINNPKTINQKRLLKLTKNINNMTNNQIKEVNLHDQFLKLKKTFIKN